MVFYFGACAGGIWKTDRRRHLSGAASPTASWAARRSARSRWRRSDPNVIYAGTGETAIRLDVSYGDGIYKSTDAGRTWSHVGLQEQQVHRPHLHPSARTPTSSMSRRWATSSAPTQSAASSAPRTAARAGRRSCTAATSRARSTSRWIRNNPRILFASIWEARRNFWNISSGGPGSGLFRSHRRRRHLGGDLAQARPARRPAGQDRRVGLAGARGPRLGAGRGRWATRPASTAPTTTARAGRMVSPNRDLMHRPWYYTHVFADPAARRHRLRHQPADVEIDRRRQRASARSRRRTATTTISGSIPTIQHRMIEGNDGGAYVSFNGGAILVDDLQPADRAVLSHRHRQPVSLPRLRHAAGQHLDRGAERVATGARSRSATAPIPAPARAASSPSIRDDPNIVYVGAIGSSPGGAGALQRYDHRTRPDPAGQRVARGIDRHRAART